ncbi:DUF1758 domain-containing protein, partial [Trichonephila clavipes]
NSNFGHHTGQANTVRGINADQIRLRTATKRLINENYFEAFVNLFKQWESEGIIEAVPINQLAKKVHYLPHRPVIKPSSNTTKVRPVFDASFKKPDLPLE